MSANNTAIPSAFKCAVDGKWLTADHFSQRQISKWQQQKKKLKDGVTPNTVGLICKEHVEQNQRQMENREIHCNGPCGAWKPKDKFSKNQRNIDNPWCMSCTFWATNVGRQEAPSAHPGVDGHSQETLHQPSPVQDGVADDRASRTEAHGTVTGTTAVRSAVAHTTTYQSSRITSDQQQNIDTDFENFMSIIQDARTSKTRSTTLGDQGPPQDTSVGNFVGHTSLKGELVMMRGPASGLASTPSDLQGNTISVEGGKPQLYNHDPFVPGGRPAENSTTAATPEPFKAPTVFDRPEKEAKGKWARPDTRKVFYAERVYKAPQEDFNTHDPDWESDDEVEF
ncbi:uncharacterized protein F4807DRAFT_467190 [Annulohypoxylon truncatum]|uniref:uncharacterized protein n=1 Tax=Annulohypoxylon truncatum TaxID=327061 RepID=UPI002007A516|nr:uncharacterized protein F4807DRAFT_467190 [Annulohypoxylon truncatum]KAI1210455.1 hypothetical protein F4807DRAFT_467190 [Annulohypoxylon truncatum]